MDNEHTSLTELLRVRLAKPVEQLTPDEAAERRELTIILQASLSQGLTPEERPDKDDE